jgi:hypothetical protein
VNIRTYQRGDEAAQVAIWNEAASDLPKFKPTTLDEIRRRVRGADFDPDSRFVAVEGDLVVGYANFQANGRVSYPWCRKGCERAAEPLFQTMLEAMRARGMRRAFAAYRADWAITRDFFLGHGFQQAREMVNFIIDLVEMPTPAARPGSVISPLEANDLPAVLALAPEALRVSSPADLERHLLQNSGFKADSVFVLRSRTDNSPVAVGVLVVDPTYADPNHLDAAMPCYRLGVFGTEGMSVKRINGVFSFLAKNASGVNAFGLDLVGHAAFRLRDTSIDTLAAQVPSDVPHLLRFYQQYFRPQGRFPVFERDL